MYAPVGVAREEPEAVEAALQPHALVCSDGGPPPDLDPLDVRILTGWMERQSWSQIAKTLGVGVGTIRARWNRPSMQAVVARLQRNLFDQLSRGDFGGLALIKANQVSAIKTTLRLMRTATKESVQLEAARDILKLAGMQPAKATVFERPEQLLDEMTQEELEHFSLTNEFPKRLADKMARMAAGVLQSRTTKVEGTVETTWERVGPAPYEPPVVVAEAEAEAAILDDPPLQVEDTDGPEWGELPDETMLDEEGA